MLPAELTKFFRDNWDAIAANLGLVAGALVLGFLVGWIVSERLNAGKLDALDQRQKLAAEQAADYKRKLDGASPDEAKERVAAMEAEIARLSEKIAAVEGRNALEELNKATLGFMEITPTSVAFFDNSGPEAGDGQKLAP